MARMETMTKEQEQRAFNDRVSQAKEQCVKDIAEAFKKLSEAIEGGAEAYRQIGTLMLDVGLCLDESPPHIHVGVDADVIVFFEKEETIRA